MSTINVNFSDLAEFYPDGTHVPRGVYIHSTGSAVSAVGSRLKKLKLNGTTLETPLSNGTFYYLADEPKIGFRGDWKEKYGK